MDNKKYLQAAFFCHLVAEKSLKAMVVKATEEVPPKTHKLKKLAMVGQIFSDLSDEQLALLDELDPLNIEARYPEYKESLSLKLNIEYCKNLLRETEEFLCWIKQKLKK